MNSNNLTQQETALNKENSQISAAENIISINSFPDEMLLHLLSFVSTSDLSQWAKVSSRFRALTSEALTKRQEETLVFLCSLSPPERKKILSENNFPPMKITNVTATHSLNYAILFQAFFTRNIEEIPREELRVAINEIKAAIKIGKANAVLLPFLQNLERYNLSLTAVIGHWFSHSHDEIYNFIHEKLPQMKIIPDTEKSIAHINLNGATIRCASLSSQLLTNLDLRYAELNRATFECEFKYLKPRFTVSHKLERLDLSHASLRKANMSGCRLYELNAKYADMRNMNLSSARIKRGDFYMANLQGGNCALANIKGSNFTKTNCDNVNFTRTRFIDPKFDGTTFRGAFFDSASFNCRDFNSMPANAILTGAIFTNIASLKNILFSEEQIKEIIFIDFNNIIKQALVTGDKKSKFEFKKILVSEFCLALDDALKMIKGHTQEAKIKQSIADHIIQFTTHDVYSHAFLSNKKLLSVSALTEMLTQAISHEIFANSNLGVLGKAKHTLFGSPNPLSNMQQSFADTIASINRDQCTRILIEEEEKADAMLPEKSVMGLRKS